jgi:DNA (cytosine-5)-methyltransferase 1
MTNIGININSIIKEMDLTKLSKAELLEKCKEFGITKCKSKNKDELLNLINSKMQSNEKVELTIEEINLTKLSKAELLVKCEELGITKCKSKNKCELLNLINNKMQSKEQVKLTIENCQENTNTNTNNESVEKNEIKQQNISIDGSLKFIDLFCGIGGFHQALTKLGFNCVFASDIDENCRKTYEKNYGLKPQGDITKIKIDEIPNFDILCGGFPCQPFSKAGFQKGFEDSRGNLFFDICKIVESHRPMYLILENVRNLATHDDGNTWKVIRQSIEDLGYYTYDEPVLLNVLHFNIPQNRERVVIMCKRMDLGELPQLPSIDKNPKQNLTCFVDNIIDENAPDIKLTGKMKDVHLVWDNFIKLLYNNNIEIPKFPIWTDWWDKDFDENDEFYVKYKSWIDKNIEFYNENFIILNGWLNESRENENWIGAVRKFEWQAGNLSEKNNSLNKCLWTARGSGIRVKKCDYIPTLVAMSMIPIYGPKNRKLTPLELLRLQSFNDSFKYDEKHIYKQLGNAVNVKMIENCVRFLIYGENLFTMN